MNKPFVLFPSPQQEILLKRAVNYLQTALINSSAAEE